VSSPTPPPARTDARVLYLTREGCHLCEVALPRVEQEARRAGTTVEVRDIDAEGELTADWNDHVPVVIVDGAVHARYEVDPAALRAALAPRPFWRRWLGR